MPPLVDPKAQGDPVNALLGALVGVLEAHQVPYTFTGSFSLGFWAQPRSSKDIDLVVLRRGPWLVSQRPQSVNPMPNESSSTTKVSGFDGQLCPRHGVV